MMKLVPSIYGDATYLFMSPMINGSSAIHAGRDGFLFKKITKEPSKGWL
jgi:hypothetical protein